MGLRVSASWQISLALQPFNEVRLKLLRLNIVSKFSCSAPKNVAVLAASGY